MCGDSKPTYTVTLSSVDRTSGDANSYTVNFPDAVAPALYKCSLKVIMGATAPTALYIRSSTGLVGLNLMSAKRNGYVAALVYSNLVAAEGDLILDVRGGTPSDMDILHSIQATGAFRTDTSEHIIRMTLTPI